MGVVRYLCITILLVGLLNATPDCNGKGWINAGGVCVCQSGYDGAACENNFGTCEMSTAPASNKKDDRFPVLDKDNDKITFLYNHLNLSIVGPVVPMRVYNNIVFVGSTAPQCSLNGTNSFWRQSGANCKDRFALTMPWGSWNDCHFAKGSTADNTYWEYTATFLITYTDFLGTPYEVDGDDYKPTLYRHSSVAYKVYVRFQKLIDLSVTNIIANSTTDLKTAITKFEYNPDGMVLTLGIKAIVSWPNMYVRSSVSLNIVQTGTAYLSSVKTNPFTVNAVATPAADASQDICPGDDNARYYRSFCLQYFEFMIYLDDTHCDFNAQYTLTGDVKTCRDGAVPDGDSATCTHATQENTHVVTASDVCGSVTASPSISGKLMSYNAPDYATFQQEFELGYRGYFEVVMDTKNDFNMTFVDIWVVADQDVSASGLDVNDISIQQIQWLYRDSQVQTKGFHKSAGGDFSDSEFSTSPVDLQVHDLRQNANSDVVYTPRFDFRFDSRIFHIAINPNGYVRKGYTLHAKGKITYAGNEGYAKRSEEIVDFVWSSEDSSLDTKLEFGLSAGSESSAVAGSNNNYNALAYSLAPVAGVALCVVAAVVIAVVVIKKRSARSFATLAN